MLPNAGANARTADSAARATRVSTAAETLGLPFILLRSRSCFSCSRTLDLDILLRSLVGETRVQRVAIRRRVRGQGRDAELATRAAHLVAALLHVLTTITAAAANRAASETNRGIWVSLSWRSPPAQNGPHVLKTHAWEGRYTFRVRVRPSVGRAHELCQNRSAGGARNACGAA